MKRAASGALWDNKQQVSMMERAQHQDVEQRILELAHARPAADLVFPLRDLARETLSKGYPREQLIEDFERVRSELREEDGYEEHEDAVMDVMDFICGWSASRMKL